MSSDERLFKFLLKCNRDANKPDMHSFTAKIKGGVVYVECREYETYVKSTVYDDNGNETIKQWIGTPVAMANLLETLEIDLDTMDM